MCLDILALYYIKSFFIFKDKNFKQTGIQNPSLCEYVR